VAAVFGPTQVRPHPRRSTAGSRCPAAGSVRDPRRPWGIVVLNDACNGSVP